MCFIDGHVADEISLKWYTENPADAIVIPDNLKLHHFAFKVEAYPLQLVDYKTGITDLTYALSIFRNR